MAKSKIEIELCKDRQNISCFAVSRKTGKLSYDEVMEYLFRHGYYGCTYIILMSVPEDELPDDLYDNKGDIWLLYEPYDILPYMEQFYN